MVVRTWRGVEDSPGWTYVHFIARPDIGRRDPVRGRWAVALASAGRASGPPGALNSVLKQADLKQPRKIP